MPAGPLSNRAAEDPSDSVSSFPALGGVTQARVKVEWNRYYDCAGLAEILRQLHTAFPELTRLYSLGKSYEGRELWCLEVSAFNKGEPARKPGMYIDGNIHGNEVQAGEVVAYTAWYLCHQYGRIAKITELLDHAVLYLVPTINPDGRDRWFHQSLSVRSGAAPYDNDRDGLRDEDGPEDLDQDGAITQMRVKDALGRWKPHPDYPELLLVPAAPDEAGTYILLGSEGIDNDGDGQVNEDSVGGYDLNRNWGWDWQPEFVQGGAHEYPFSLPETRAVAAFVRAHPNIAAFQSYHNAGGMILRSPGREGGMIQREDDTIMDHISRQGEKMLPFYRRMTIWRDLYTVWGGEIDWLYGAEGILGFTNELWNKRNLYRDSRDPTQDEEAAFIKHLLFNDGAVRWHPFKHPLYGDIEIGGLKKEWGRAPVSFLLEEECHRNMAFTLYHADQMPRLRISECRSERLESRLFKIQVAIENERMIPTRTRQDVKNRINPPDVVSLKGERVEVIASGRITDRFTRQVEPTRRRPYRVEVDAMPGLERVEVQFIIKGEGAFEVTVDSAKGGKLTKTAQLP
jgi:murein tripeptide amidase MpaA